MSIRVVMLVCILASAAALAQQTNTSSPVAQPGAGTATDVSAAERVNIAFDPLPAGWIADQQVMDPIWEPLGIRGVNHYAYGGRVSPSDFSSRSDPARS